MNTKVWKISDIKDRAKEAFKRNYWWCVLAALILGLVSGGGGGGSYSGGGSSGSSDKEINQLIQQVENGNVDSDTLARVGIALAAVGAIILVVFFIAFVIGIVLKVLLFNPLEMGGNKFFLENEMEKKNGIGCFVDAFRGGHYGNIVMTLFMRDLYIFLWSLLLIIPGIIKKYEYRMVPYILAEHPEMGYKEALEKSSRIMNGQKMNAFVLDLSFIGWAILSALTLGILGIFWVNPYIYATNAELYLELSDEGGDVASYLANKEFNA